LQLKLLTNAKIETEQLEVNMSESTLLKYNHKTELPEYIFKLLESGKISANDFILFSIYKHLCRKSNLCSIGTRTLEKKCRLSDKTITSSKRNLSKSFDLLNGRSLIQIEPGDKTKSQPDSITIIENE